MEQQYFTTQVQEVRLTKQEILKIVTENVALRASIGGYDFDHQRPIIVELPNGGLSLRFVQEFMLKDSRVDSVTMEPLEKYKNPAK